MSPSFAPAVALGGLLGLRHALEADHVATVAALSLRSAGWRQTAKVAAAWGLGHGASLLALSALLLWLDAALPPPLARLFEAATGALLVGLGAAALLRRRSPTGHDHDHAAPNSPRRPLVAGLVGGVHGLAGTGALVVLSVGTLRSSALAFAWLVAFSAGAVLGMAAVSLVLSLPLGGWLQSVSKKGRAPELVLGALNVALGGWIVLRAL